MTCGIYVKYPFKPDDITYMNTNTIPNIYGNQPIVTVEAPCPTCLMGARGNSFSVIIANMFLAPPFNISVLAKCDIF